MTLPRKLQTADQAIKDRAYCRAYYRKNRAQIIEKGRKYREAHREELVAYYKRYRNKHPRQFLEYNREGRRRRRATQKFQKLKA